MTIVAINVVLAFNMGQDTESILASAIGQPMATVRPGARPIRSLTLSSRKIFFNSFGTKPTLAIWSIVVIAQYDKSSLYG